MGLPGAGKTTILNEVSKRLSDFRIVNYGSLMMEIAEKEFNIKNRDELRKASISVQKNIQKRVGEELSKMEGKIILDTHCAVKTPKGYLPGLPLSILQNLKIDGLILVTADINEIIERRKNDPTRQRDKDDYSSLKEHDDMNRFMLATYSVITGAPCYIINNKQGKLEETVEKVINILE